jgi:hypothetical protein
LKRRKASYDGFRCAGVIATMITARHNDRGVYATIFIDGYEIWIYRDGTMMENG